MKGSPKQTFAKPKRGKGRSPKVQPPGVKVGGRFAKTKRDMK